MSVNFNKANELSVVSNNPGGISPEKVESKKSQSLSIFNNTILGDVTLGEAMIVSASPLTIPIMLAMFHGKDKPEETVNSKPTNNVTVTGPNKVEVGQTVPLSENDGIKAEQKHEDGSTTTVSHSGITLKDASGNPKINVGAEGISIKQEDGTWKKIPGTAKLAEKGLSDLEVAEDGTITAHDADGKKIVISPDGTIKIFSEGNSQFPATKITPNGEVKNGMQNLPFPATDIPTTPYPGINIPGMNNTDTNAIGANLTKYDEEIPVEQ